MAEEVAAVYPPQNTENAGDDALTAYKKLYKDSITDTQKFWTETGSKALTWFSPFTSAIQGSFEEGNIAFYSNGKLNVCYNCLDRWVESGKGDDVAVIWEGDQLGDSQKFTFQQVLNQVCQTANMLKSIGVQKGDTVTIYMPMKIDILVVMLACARIGAVHSVVFAGFSAGGFLLY